MGSYANGAFYRHTNGSSSGFGADMGNTAYVRIASQVRNDLYGNSLNGFLDIKSPESGTATSPSFMGRVVTRSDGNGWLRETQSNAFTNAYGATAHADVNAFRLYFSSGTIASGTISVYGVSNS